MEKIITKPIKKNCKKEYYRHEGEKIKKKKLC